MSAAGLRLVADASQAHARLAGHVSSRVLARGRVSGVIGLLGELVDGLRGDAVAFRDDLVAAATASADLSRIEDVRTLHRAP